MNAIRLRVVMLLSLSCIGFVLAGSCLASLHAADGAYPNKPITVVVAMVPGGQFDLAARVTAEALEKQLKQPVVVVNKPGAAGTVGGYTVSSAKPDGYTLGYFHNASAVPEAYTYFYSAPYSSSDLIPVCRVHTLLTGITVKGDAPWNSLKDFVEYARKNPGTKFAHNGRASLQYLVMTTIAKAEKLNLVDVPYDGDGAVLPALLGGHVPIGVPAFSVVKPQLEAKKLKILALCADKRVAYAPDIPTIVELGYKLPYVISVGLFAPKKTPPDILKKIDEAVHRIVDEKAFQARNKEMDMVIAYQDSASYEKELAQFKSNTMAFFKEQGMVK